MQINNNLNIYKQGAIEIQSFKANETPKNIQICRKLTNGHFETIRGISWEVDK